MKSNKYLLIFLGIVFLFQLQIINAENNTIIQDILKDPSAIEKYDSSVTINNTDNNIDNFDSTFISQDQYSDIKKRPTKINIPKSDEKLKDEKESQKDKKEPEKYEKAKTTEYNHDIPSLEDIFASQVSQIIDQDIIPFGYDVFNIEPTSLAKTSSMLVNADYILGPGDTLVLDVWGGITLHLNLIIDKEGKVVIPSVGSIYLAGVAYGQVKDVIKNKLNNEYQNISIEVTMGRLKSINIYIVGEVKHPGSYNINSLSTVYNALFSAGGPSNKGSLRNIDVIRDKKNFAKIDLYDFLLTGNRTNDVQLKDGDTIFVNLVSNTVSISGMIKRPGIYEFVSGINLKDLINLCGGVLPTGYLKNIQVQRIVNNENKIILNLNIMDENYKLLDEFKISDNDIIKVFPILPTDKQVIYIKGHLYRPGKYELKPNMKLRDLVSSFENLFPEPAENYAQIIRLESPNFHPVIIPFNLGDLLKGDDKDNIILKPFDTIVLFSKWDFSKEPEVTIEGEVRKPGKYRLFTGMKLSDLIFLGGGIKKEAYIGDNQLYRINDSARKENLILFNLQKLLLGEKSTDILLQDEDRVVINNIWDLEDKPIVTIEGAVRNPGKFTLVKNMRVSELIYLAGNAKKDAFLEEFQVTRTHNDREIEVFTYNLKKALSGDENHNVLLHDEDKIVVKNIWDIKEKRYVAIEGEIMKPGIYRLGENMTLRDLIYQAGYIKNSAYLKDLEIVRYLPEQEGVTVKKINVSLEKVLENNIDANITLSSMDKVFIKKIPDWDNIGNIVKISGQVTHPGIYSISKDEILSKVIERAGGFSEGSYLVGAVLTRKSIKELQKVRLNEMILKLEQEILRAGTQEAASSVNSEEAKITSLILQSQKDLLEKLRSVEPTGRIIIKLNSLAKFRGTKDDICLQHGDELFIPKRPDIVLVTGEVYNPSAIIFQENHDAEYYLNEVGGPTKSADNANMYVIKSDGTVFSKENFYSGYKWWNPFTWWSGSILTAKLSPGDTILVPEKVMISHTLRNVKDVTTILYDIAVATQVWKTISK